LAVYGGKRLAWWQKTNREAKDCQRGRWLVDLHTVSKVA